MKRPLTHAAVVLLATLAPSTRGADLLVATNNPATVASGPSHNSASRSAAPTKGLSLEAFQLISDRNIFNPNRSGRGGDREVTRREPERRIRTESIALVGTLSYDKGDFAFFDGSNSDYRRSLQASGTIGGFTVTTITPKHVVLQASGTNETEFTLPLGMQLQRHDEGRWEVAARPDPGGSSFASTSASSPSSGGGGGSDEVLKRLMQQREQDGGAPAPNSAAVPEAAPAAVPAASSASNGAEDEVLKRLMQRREKGE